MKESISVEKESVTESDLHERLNSFMACGYPIFIFGKSVCWPVEADEFFTGKELKELEKHILSSH